MMKMIIRGTIDVVFGLLTLPIRILLILSIGVIAPVNRIKNGVPMVDTFNSAKEGFLWSLEREIRWIKTGSIY